MGANAAFLRAMPNRLQWLGYFQFEFSLYPEPELKKSYIMGEIIEAVYGKFALELYSMLTLSIYFVLVGS